MDNLELLGQQRHHCQGSPTYLGQNKIGCRLTLRCCWLKPRHSGAKMDPCRRQLPAAQTHFKHGRQFTLSPPQFISVSATSGMPLQDLPRAGCTPAPHIFPGKGTSPRTVRRMMLRSHWRAPLCCAPQQLLTPAQTFALVYTAGAVVGEML